jgi:hypothetical protein
MCIALPAFVFETAIAKFNADWKYPCYMVLLGVSAYSPNIAILAKDTKLILMFRSLEKAIRCVKSVIQNFKKNSKE